MIRVTSEAVDASAELREFMRSAGEGAVATFIGTVRGDGAVERLTLDHYAGFTETQISAFVERLIFDHQLTAATVVHRHGEMKPGETILFAATAAPHRRAALDALDTLVEQLKTDAPFWKRELRGGTDHWLEPALSHVTESHA